MPDEKSDVKSLEMRIAAIEDKLNKLNISEEDMKTYQRVSAALGGGGGAEAGPALGPEAITTVCAISRFRFRNRVRIVDCNECGPCIMSGGGGGFSGGGGGGFGNFGG
jgi:hypothetical protein